MVGRKPYIGMVAELDSYALLMVATCGILCVVRGVQSGLLIVPALMFWTTGCTEEADKAGGDDTIAVMTAPEPVFPMDVSGVVVVESVHAIRHAGSRCLMEGDLRRLIGPLKTPVVIEAPDGQMARAEIVEAAATDVPGVCTFSFYASQVPALDGEYIARIPELGVEVRFDQNHAGGVELRYIE